MSPLMVLQWRQPERAMELAWRGPDGSVLASIARGDVAGIAAVIGPPGPIGPPASGAATRFDVASPAGTWIIGHGFGRVPSVQIFLVSGEAVITDVTVDTVHITATFGSPTAGFVLAA